MNNNFIEISAFDSDLTKEKFDLEMVVEFHSVFDSKNVAPLVTAEITFQSIKTSH